MRQKQPVVTEQWLLGGGGEEEEGGDQLTIATFSIILKSTRTKSLEGKKIAVIKTKNAPYLQG